MTTDIHALLSERDRAQRATDMGTHTHKKMQHIFIGGDTEQGDPNHIAHIKQNPSLLKFFGPQSRAEVPVAGTVNGRFISRRIDRLFTDPVAKIVEILDFKTDINKDKYHDNYVYQLREYITLMRQIYPDFTVRAHILWTHDWTLESV